MAEVIARAFQGWSTGLNKGLELGEKAFGKVGPHSRNSSTCMCKQHRVF